MLGLSGSGSRVLDSLHASSLVRDLLRFDACTSSHRPGPSQAQPLSPPASGSVCLPKTPQTASAAAWEVVTQPVFVTGFQIKCHYLYTLLVQTRVFTHRSAVNMRHSDRPSCFIISRPCLVKHRREFSLGKCAVDGYWGNKMQTDRV